MTIKEKIALFPHSPGVYRYYDGNGTIIYVGKAKDLHKRVAQYFVDPSRLNLKTSILVGKIADAQFTVVDSEADALLLENNLIKQYQPRYNILLKDSKTYPWICISNETYPRVFLTRRKTDDGERYFGPYSNVRHAYALLDFFKEMYPLRSCRLKISSSDILHAKARPCLDFHIGKCKGCCVGAVSVQEYGNWIAEITKLLEGGGKAMIDHYRHLMQEASLALEFEKANIYKGKMEALLRHYSKSLIVDSTSGSFDVFGLVFDGDNAYGSFLRVVDGSVIAALSPSFKLRIEEDREEVLSLFIEEMRQRFGSLAPEIIVPWLPADSQARYCVPSRGYKLSLLSLATRNADEKMAESLRQKEHSDPAAYRLSTLESLRDALSMKELPKHIECFDNSNIQGTNPVAACVVFKEGVPSKKDYRHFVIKTVVGANDYASMKEIVNRRYSRLLAQGQSLPQLIVVDGGKGQLAVAYEALSELGLTSNVTLIALAERLEEVIRVGDPYPLFLDRNSEALKLLQRIRDEAHRFGITHHRLRRSKSMVRSALDDIKGVGPRTRQKLLIHFGSVKRIQEASEQEIAAVTGAVLAHKIVTSLKS